MTLTLFSRQIVTPTAVISGNLVIENGLICEIVPSEQPALGAESLGDDVLIPGLVDIHTDNLEKHFQPRPGAQWDSVGAALAHDGQCAAAGITTVFDSLSLHGRKEGLDRKDALAPMINGVDYAASQGMLRVDHLLHLRAEVTNPELTELMEPYRHHPRLRLLSVMDHTPGQRQTADLKRFEARLVSAGHGAHEVAEMLATQTVGRDQSAAPANRAYVVAMAHKESIPLMSHDDESSEHVEESWENGCVASEFPVSLSAAKLARERGMLNVMGAPNFVRGASHSGNLGARDCAQAGLLDVLASDYIPLSMVRAAFQLTEAPFHWSLSEAIATVTDNPARVAGLTDRGAIVVGRRADLVRIAYQNPGWPVVRRVWCEGQRVA
jgi:alpha-D-ribose 1-methylphosphonate 5-triphosphate diphosphatase